MNFLDSNIISRISHIHSECAEFLRAELNKKGLPNLASSHGYILFLLSKEKNLSMQQISKKINRDKSTTTVLIKKLEKLNLVKSTLSLQDSRIKLIELTSQGKTYNEQTLQISNELKEKFFKNLSAEEIASLENTLSKISSNFE